VVKSSVRREIGIEIEKQPRRRAMSGAKVRVQAGGRQAEKEEKTQKERKSENKKKKTEQTGTKMTEKTEKMRRKRRKRTMRATTERERAAARSPREWKTGR
jgi:fibronectin type 3 domain-containing protein